MNQPSSLKIGLLQFPGSNCDTDCHNAMQEHFGITTVPVWHTESNLPALSGLIIPGGFSYGDYLRGGALAAFSPILREVKRFAESGRPIIGICNGFQILTEAKLLPGTLLKNSTSKFICKYVDIKSPQGEHSIYQKTLGEQKLSIPIAHGEGRYCIDQDGLNELYEHGQIAFTYVGENPNGSCDQIAGVTSKDGRILGMMPHPERAMSKSTGGSNDGKLIWESFLALCS